MFCVGMVGFVMAFNVGRDPKDAANGPANGRASTWNLMDKAVQPQEEASMWVWVKIKPPGDRRF